MSLPGSILRLLKQLETDKPKMPPTLLYNEGWMLRMILDAVEMGLLLDDIFPENARWFSEAQLKTPFGRDKGGKYETNTHADGVVGDFSDLTDTKSGVELPSDAKNFLIFEAKMYSPLSSRTKNAPGFDQAARNVACIAYTLQRAFRKPEKIKNMSKVGFYVIAPQSQIDSGLFDAPMSSKSIRSRVSERIQQFTGRSRDTLADWQQEWFTPLVEKMEIEKTLKCLSWEGLIDQITNQEIKTEIEEFYKLCKKHNMAVSRSADNTGRPTRGMEYLLSSGNQKGQRVRVCSVGRENSRVYLKGNLAESFLVPNVNLELIPESDQTPPPPDPIAGREYEWKGQGGSIRVSVINVGDCNSRVIRADSTGNSFKVPNHQLHDLQAKTG